MRDKAGEMMLSFIKTALRRSTLRHRLRNNREELKYLALYIQILRDQAETSYEAKMRSWSEAQVRRRQDEIIQLDNEGYL